MVKNFYNNKFNQLKYNHMCVSDYGNVFCFPCHHSNKKYKFWWYSLNLHINSENHVHSLILYKDYLLNCNYIDIINIDITDRYLLHNKLYEELIKLKS